MRTIDKLIEMLHELYSYPTHFNMTTPAYREFHTAITDYIHLKKLDDTGEWHIIKPLLLVRSSQYMTSGEADRILEALESLKRKSLKCEEPFWVYIHPSIKNVSVINFDAGQYADAVSNAFAELESSVKDAFQAVDGRELTGKDLMMKAFGDAQPNFCLADTSTISGRNIQEGYRFIYAGVMCAIRNPNAHANLSTTKEDAIDYIVLASMLIDQPRFFVPG